MFLFVVLLITCWLATTRRALERLGLAVCHARMHSANQRLSCTSIAFLISANYQLRRTLDCWTWSNHLLCLLLNISTDCALPVLFKVTQREPGTAARSTELVRTAKNLFCSLIMCSSCQIAVFSFLMSQKCARPSL